MCCVAAGSAALQGALSGLASKFPRAYIQSVFSGMVIDLFIKLQFAFKMNNC